MPIEFDDEIVRRNEANFKLLDDRNITGGYHVVPDLATRNGILSAQRKAGMLVLVQDQGAPPGTIYQLQANLTTWTEWAGGGGGGGQGFPPTDELDLPTPDSTNVGNTLLRTSTGQPYMLDGTMPREVAIQRAPMTPVDAPEPVLITVLVSDAGIDAPWRGGPGLPFRTLRYALQATLPPMALGRRWRFDCSDLTSEVLSEPLTMPQMSGSGWYDYLTDAFYGPTQVATEVEIYSKPTAAALTVTSGQIASIVDDANSALITVTVTGAAWTVDQWKDFNGVDDNGNTFGVISNTNNALVLTLGTANIGSAGFRLFQPATTIDASATTAVFNTYSKLGYSLGFVGIKFTEGSYGVSYLSADLLALQACYTNGGFSGAISTSCHVYGCVLTSASRFSGNIYLDGMARGGYFAQSICRSLNSVSLLGGAANVFSACYFYDLAFSFGPLDGASSYILRNMWLDTCVQTGGYAALRFDGTQGNVIHRTRIDNAPVGLYLERSGGCESTGRLGGNGNAIAVQLKDDSWLSIQTGETPQLNFTGSTLGDIHCGLLPYRSCSDFLNNIPVGLEYDAERDGSMVIIDNGPDPFTAVAALPTPSAYFRGRIRTVAGGVGVADTSYICVKNSSDVYVWKKLGANVLYFDVQDFGATGDGTTDDGPAIQAACDAAASTTGNGRSGIVLFSPCSDSYRIATPIVVTVPFSGSAADTFTLQGFGQDSPIKPDLTNAQNCFTLTGGGEFFSGRIRNLMTVTSDLTQATPDCKSVFELGASGPGTWDVQDVTSQGTYCYAHWFHLLDGQYRLANLHDSATIAFGADYTYMIHCDGSDLVEFDEVYSFWQGLWRNTVLQGGTSRALIGVTPRNSATYNGNKQGTRVVGRNIFDTSPRNLQLLYCYGGDAQHVAKGIHLEHFFKSHGGNDFFYVQDCDTLELAHGTNATTGSGGGASRYELGDRVKHFTLRNVNTCQGLPGEAYILIYGSVVVPPEHIEVIDSDLNATTGAPCGVKLLNATSTKAFITSKGLRACVRQADGAIVSSTLGKPSTSAAGKVSQFLATDGVELVSCAVLETATNGDFVRCVEQQGQQVQLKSDGVYAIGAGDGVDPSSVSDGRITAGAGLLGTNTGAAVAASADALVEVL